MITFKQVYTTPVPEELKNELGWYVDMFDCKTENDFSIVEKAILDNLHSVILRKIMMCKKGCLKNEKN